MTDEEQERERRREVLRHALPDIVSGAVAGALQANGLDPTSAGALAPTIAAVMRLDTWTMSRRLDRGEQVVAMTAEQLGSVELLEELATADDPRLELTARVLEAAARTTMAEKIRALSQVLANGLAGQAQADEAMALAGVLANLEATHVQVLAALTTEPPA